ncbi:MAG: MFS transporter [Actinocatenispora sp.]
MLFTHAGRDVGILAVATGISFAGDFMAANALVLTLQAHGASGFGIAALLLAATVPTVVLAPAAGRIVDRYSSRVLLITVGAAQALVCAALAYVSAPVAVIALMALLASGLAVTNPTMAALIPQIVRRDQLGRASAHVQTVRMLGILAGPALAGVLVGGYGPRLPLLIDASSYLAVVAAGLLVRTVRRGGPLTAPATGRATGGLGLVRRDPLLVGYLVLVTAGVAAVTADSVGSVFLIRATLHASTTTYGLLEGLWAVAVIGGTWLIGRRTPGDVGLVRLVVGVLVVFGGVLLGMSAAPSLPWLVPLYVVGGMANGGLNLSSGVLFGRRVEPDARGRVGAVFAGVTNGGTLIGYVAGGLLLQVLAPRALYALCGAVVLLVIATMTVPVLRAARRAAPSGVVGPPSYGPVPASDAAPVPLCDEATVPGAVSGTGRQGPAEAGAVP